MVVWWWWWCGGGGVVVVVWWWSGGGDGTGPKVNKGHWVIRAVGRRGLWINEATEKSGLDGERGRGLGLWE